MMKKLLFLMMTFMAITMSASAQGFQLNPNGKLGKSVVNKAKKVAPLAAKGEIEWSYFTGSSSEWGGLGTNSANTFHVAIELPSKIGDISLVGATLKGINIPVVSTSMTEVSVWAKSSLADENLKEATTSGPFVVGNFTKVVFDEPLTIPEGGLFVGYTFTTEDSYPIAVAGESPAGSLWLKIADGEWGDYTSYGYGASALQAVIADIELPDVSAKFENLQGQGLLVGQTFTTQVELVNNSGNAIQSIDYTIDIDGMVEQKHLDLEEVVPAGLNVRRTIEVDGISPDAPKHYTVKVNVDKVNGEANEAQAAATFAEASFYNVSKVVPRMTVVEEFTGTGCGWCPRGWVGMEKLKKNYSDKCLVVAFHKYNSTDPMYVVNYYPTQSLGISGAPSCAIDRKVVVDPYSGSGYGIANDVLAYNTLYPEVDVKVLGYWNEDKSAVDIQADFEALCDGGDYSVAYVLTADSLSGTTNAWKQTNYYNYRYGQFGSADELPEDLRYFYDAGELVSQSVVVPLVFNDVMIGSSYSTTGVNQAKAIEGANDTKNGTSYTGTYSVKMPTKTTLKSAINENLVFANVLIVNNTNNHITNAARVQVVGNPDGVTEVSTSKSKVEVARYTVDGKQIAAPQRGLNIVRMADGKTVKVLVK